MSNYYQEREDGRRGRHDDYDDRDNYRSQQYSQRPYQGNDDDDSRRPSYQSRGGGYVPPPGPPSLVRDQRPFQGNDGDDPRRPSYQSRGDGYTPPPGPPSSVRDQRSYQGNDDDDSYRRPQSYRSQGQDQGRGHSDYTSPSGPPPSARGPTGLSSLGGLDRGDFASDADIDRMVSSGEFDERKSSGRQGYGYGAADLDRRDVHDRQDVSSGRTQGQGYGARDNEYDRYDAPPRAPPGRGYQSQQSSEQGYGSSYGGGSDRPSQYGSSQTQGRTQYESSQGPPAGRGRGQGNAPAGGFSASRDGEGNYGSKYGGPTNDRDEPPYRGEAASYYNEQSAPGRDDRYAHLAGMAHGDDDPELYRRATQGLHEKIQAQQSRRPKGEDEDDYKAHTDAHRKAYGGDDHGPMDADAIGAAAAMEAIKQTAASGKSSNAPAGGFQSSLGGGGPSSGRGKVAEEETDTAAAHAGADGSRGLQDKMMALAMSHAGKLFDKKNAGSGSSGGDKSQDKAQAMQSAAATAMQLYSKYQTGKLDPSDMTSVMSLAMKMM